MTRNRKVKPTQRRQPLVTEVLLTRDGHILVHNLTPSFAQVLSRLDPRDPILISRSNARRRPL